MKFPAILFLLALASFFPLTNFIGQAVIALRPIAPAEVLNFLEEQLRRLSNADSGGILTLGILGAIWSSSAALVAIIGSLNRAYDIEEGRPWWKVRLTAVGLTFALAAMILVSFSLIVVGPTVAEHLTASFGFGALFEWTWKILQWPLAFLLVSTAVGLVYYFAPDAEQDWVWITPGAILGTMLWVIVSLAFKVYVANFADYNATYGAVGGVIVLLLWFYISGLAILVGAEMNAEIEHASPYGKDPGEKVPGQKKKIGAAAARAYKERIGQQSAQRPASLAISRPAPAFQGMCAKRPMGQESNKVTPASAPSVTTEEIRSQIDQTRAKISETINAIQNDLSPRRLMMDAKEKVNDDAERAIQVVTSNPVPMALIGVAVAAITARVWMRSRNGTSRTASIRNTYAGHTTPRRFGRSKRTLLLGACSGFACWRAWRAYQ